MAVLGTWAFSESAVDQLRSLISSGRQATDAVEEALAGWFTPTGVASQSNIV